MCALAVPLKLVFALAVAMILDKGIARPAALSRDVLSALAARRAASRSPCCGGKVFAGDGLVNSCSRMFGIAGAELDLQSRLCALHAGRAEVWQFGSPMIIFLAGLRQIPRDLYEAAELDGASKRAAVLASITLPLLTPVIFFNAVRADDRRVQGLHAGLHHLERHRRPGQLDAVLHALSLPGGVRAISAWATRRRSPGSCWSIIACFTAFSFLTSRYWVHYED